MNILYFVLGILDMTSASGTTEIIREDLDIRSVWKSAFILITSESSCRLIYYHHQCICLVDNTHLHLPQYGKVSGQHEPLSVVSQMVKKN